MPYRSKTARVGVCVLLLLLISASGFAQNSVPEVMDALIGRIYATLSLEQICAMDDARVQQLLEPGERRVLATKHWNFDVDVPVTVSILHGVDQKVTPFWLAEAGFTKTELSAKNVDGWRYEIWQKNFPAGRVELGINGFDEFRPHYLVCAGAQEAGRKVTFSGFHPGDQIVTEMKEGASTYGDWTELVLTEIPESLRGQYLLPTTRGRAREASLVGAFRKTPFPSSTAPEPVFLTWSGEPSTTQDVHWRTNPQVNDGVVRYREKGSSAAFAETPAGCRKMEDRLLANDRFCNWFTASLRGLAPGTAYEYVAGSPAADAWSAPAEFVTAPASPAPFSFLYCSDTHNHKDWGELLCSVFKQHPEAAFCTVSGDLVGTGLERDDWDQFLTYGEAMFRQRPLMPAIGNHDAQLGLGPGMYLDILSLPENGPKDITPERAYTFCYGNAQFFVLDVMSDVAAQAVWLREVLAKSTATWKVAIFHFPLYLAGEDYPDMKAQWASLFDRYHVDLVLTGHVHNHIRSYPLRGGKRAASPAEGTVYITSVSIPSDPLPGPKPELVEQWVGGGAFCNLFHFDGNRCTFQALAADGTVKDAFTLQK